MCLSVCLSIYMFKYMSIYLSIVCVCVGVCMCACMRACACVCAHAFVSPLSLIPIPSFPLSSFPLLSCDKRDRHHDSRHRRGLHVDNGIRVLFHYSILYLLLRLIYDHVFSPLRLIHVIIFTSLSSSLPSFSLPSHSYLPHLSPRHMLKPLLTHG